jgi:uncharacterized membrane protein YgdD (TMEM256/DUF423 family)
MLGALAAHFVHDYRAPGTWLGFAARRTFVDAVAVHAPARVRAAVWALGSAALVGSATWCAVAGAWSWDGALYAVAVLPSATFAALNEPAARHQD